MTMHVNSLYKTIHVQVPELKFLPVGHTHEDVNQFFSKVSQSLRKRSREFCRYEETSFKSKETHTNVHIYHSHARKQQNTHTKMSLTTTGGEAKGACVPEQGTQHNICHWEIFHCGTKFQRQK